jgi:hypothetical protein
MVPFHWCYGKTEIQKEMFRCNAELLAEFVQPFATRPKTGLPGPSISILGKKEEPQHGMARVPLYNGSKVYWDNFEPTAMSPPEHSPIALKDTDGPQRPTFNEYESIVPTTCDAPRPGCLTTEPKDTPLSSDLGSERSGSLGPADGERCIGPLDRLRGQGVKELDGMVSNYA